MPFDLTITQEAKERQKVLYVHFLCHISETLCNLNGLVRCAVNIIANVIANVIQYCVMCNGFSSN